MFRSERHCCHQKKTKKKPLCNHVCHSCPLQHMIMVDVDLNVTTSTPLSTDVLQCLPLNDTATALSIVIDCSTKVIAVNQSVAIIAKSAASSFDMLATVSKLVILAVIILTTIVGNILVLFAVFVNSHLRTTTNYFIVNLAVADLLLGTTVLPFSASLEVLKRWDFGDLFCDVWAAVDVLCCTASIISLCAISVDRYIGVTRPLTYSTIMTETRAVVLIFVVWIVSITIGVGPLFGWKEQQHPNPEICTVTKQLDYVLFSVAGSFYIPTTVILLVYYRIYREAIKQTKFLERGVKTTKGAESSSCQEVTLRIHTGGAGVIGAIPGTRSQSSDSLSFNGHQSPDERVVRARGHHHHHQHNHHMTGLQGKLAKFKRQKKAAKTLGIVVGVFILCWFPFFFLLPLSALCNSCYIPEDLFQVFFWLGYCNSCLNPIIYATSSREFKRAFTRILRCELRRKPRVLSKETTLNKTCVITMRSKVSHLHHQEKKYFNMPTSIAVTTSYNHILQNCNNSNGNAIDFATHTCNFSSSSGLNGNVNLNDDDNNIACSTIGSNNNVTTESLLMASPEKVTP